ncbi:MAG: GNAT family N-acetyltransferase [Chloroflexi bacterium]|nr:GNAT family N-acetyltransferase [Chloroflexota bacterium]
MSDFQLRLATQHDFAIIIRFVHAMLSEMYALSSKAISDQGEAWLDFESRILQTLSCNEDGVSRYPCAADHLIEIAEMIGNEVLPIGLIEAGILHPVPIFRPVQTLCINSLYVLPQYRRRGVGTALLRAALDWGQHHGCLRAQLSVLPHNPARQLYQALGFNVYGLEMRKEMVGVN